ncbi:MAG: TetR/AcrR family transcriptional regulator [Gammaproteobacteria bacterium]|nr:TetR/AcrR family transcriptional regulator [Gammaproteobacteria bacterium]
MNKKTAGRPRSETARKAILLNTLALLEEGGLGAVTVEAVAKRAKVGKPTIYRYWSNAQELAMSALISEPADTPSEATDQDPLLALHAHLEAVIERFSQPIGRQITLLIAASDQSSHLSKAFRNQVILQSREVGRSFLEAAMASGRIRSSLPMESLLDMIYGPVFYRMLIGHAPLSQTLAEEILALLETGIKTASD